MDPCGTPQVTSKKSDRLPLTSTHCVRLHKYERNHDTDEFETPTDISFESKISWLTVSNAFCRSINTIPTKFRFATSFLIKSDRLIRHMCQLSSYYENQTDLQKGRCAFQNTQTAGGEPRVQELWIVH